MRIASFFINDIVAHTGGTLKHYHNNALVQDLVYDTRSFFVAHSALFIALNTGKRNGHAYVAEAYRKGIRNFLVDEDIVIDDEEVNIIRVPNVLKALQQWAAAHRQSFNSPVLAITGSNGKTILKEWLNTLLSPFYRIVRSPRSFNSQLGVPISLLQLENDARLAIIEVGISKPGEMDVLAQMVRPDIAVITNVEQAHAVNFTDRKQHVAEKLVLAQYAQVLVYCADNPEVHEQALKLSCQKISWGFYAGDQRFFNDNGWLSHEANGQRTVFDLHVYDKGSVQNICHAITASYALGIEPSRIKQGISSIHPVEMRFELKEGMNNCKILNDTYSLDYYSFQLAVEYVQRNAGELKRTVILSDFPEIQLGKGPFYREVGRFMTESGVQKVVGIGENIGLIQGYFKGVFEWYEDVDEFLQKASVGTFRDELILVKGSRESHFEKIVSFFDARLHSTYLKVDLAAIQHNLNEYQSMVKPGTKTMVMVKALAYGSGSREISHLLEFNKVDYLAVAYADEGVELRRSGVRLPIMVMNADEAAFNQLFAYDLQPEIFNFYQLDLLLNFLKEQNKTGFPVHIKFDTGMHRLGFKKDEIYALCKRLVAYRQYLRVESVFTHLSSSDVPAQDDYTLQQVSDFEFMYNEMVKVLGEEPLRHVLNSPGIERFPQYSFDMVRLGIGLHGIAADVQVQKKLQPVHTLVTRISHIQHLHESDTVGYGRRGVIKGDRTIATVPIGYADGYFRSLGNGKGKMYIKGQLAPTVGSVCMDMTMIDITDVPQTQVGDEVVVFGEELPVSLVASWADTIPYELLTSVSTRVKRIYIDNV